MRHEDSNRLATGLSRRQLVRTGAIAGALGAMGVPILANSADASPKKTKAVDGKANDMKVLNNALYYEHQAIWAYQVAAGSLTNTDVGKAVLAIALQNQAHHKQHRDLLASVVQQLGGKPVQAEKSYDLSSYLNKKEGALDSDVNIAKLALALETDAAIAYTLEVAKLTTPELIKAGASIGSDEAAHATVIRAAFKMLGMDIEIVPAAFVSPKTRDMWVLKV